MKKQKQNIPFRNAQKIYSVFCGICVTHSLVFYVVLCSKKLDILFSKFIRRANVATRFLNNIHQIL